jgi:nucleoside-diphosphate-sugar epimerase
VPFIAVFGVGLIGSAIVKCLGKRAPLREDIYPLIWTSSFLQFRQLRHIEDTIVSHLCGNSGPARIVTQQGVKRALRIVWSAGRAGFSSTLEETSKELSNFQHILDLTERLTLRCPDTHVTFYLLSSAGGLFERQRHVDRHSKVEPHRPYGLLKQRQEQFLMAVDIELVKKIYRPTSVYGFVRARHRMGLIPVLLLNGLRQETTHITGRMSTLRDFVCAEDVAALLAGDLLDENEAAKGSLCVLASGKPCSLYEAKEIVESTIKRKIYVNYSLDRSNSEDVSFSPVCLPPGWQASDLKLNARRIYDDLLTTGIR